MADRLVIATRESRLALWQAEHVKALLENRLGAEVTLLPMTTRGDQILDRSLAKVGGKGLFIKELENALEEGRADLAVHSLKDVPMDLPAGFALAAVLEREDPADAFVSARHASLDALPAGAIVGTSSLRRLVQLRAAFLERGLQLLDEQSLAAHLAEAAIQDLVAARGHAQQRNDMALPAEQGLHVLGLPQGKAAFTGGDDDGAHAGTCWKELGSWPMLASVLPNN